jgi:cell division protease FtsH
MTEEKRSKPRVAWWWWVLILVLLAWNVWTFWPAPKPEASIPYTAFLSQVREGNVTSVDIRSEQITGQLAKAIPWPDPASDVAAAPGTTPTAVGQAIPTPSLYTTVRTVFPQVVGDAALLPLLRAHQVEVNVQPPPSPLLTILLTYGLPLLLLVGVMVWMGSRARRSQASAFTFGRSRARRHEGNRSEVTFEDVASADEAKQDLEEVVDFLRHPQKYHDIGARIPRGVLLVGPPGTGKTLLARAVAGEADVPFFNISASEFVEMFVGVGASRVRDLFDQAKATAPAIVFIDELDAVGRRRGTGLGTVNDEREQTLNQLLVEMDGFDERHEVIILAATNRSDVLDPALLRPGRFDREVLVGLPDRTGREEILHIHSRMLRLADDVDLPLLARTTTGFSGADLANLCNEAALTAARHNHDQVKLADFEEALDRVLLGGARPMLLDARERRNVAYHEAGHAMVAWLTPDADPVHKVTIIPHRLALGVTRQMPEEDRYSYGREYLRARLQVMLAGRAAEEIALGEVTTGAESDLAQATRLARRMVTRWAMGSLGLVAFQADEGRPFLGYELTQGRGYSEETATRIDQDVQQLLDESHEHVRTLLAGMRELLERFVQELLREETLGQEDLRRILGPLPETAASVS